MTIQAFMFNPDTVAIHVGERITVTNRDPAAHTFTDKGGAFDSGVLGRDQSRTLTFSTKGTFEFWCSIHHSMTGTLTVTP